MVVRARIVLAAADGQSTDGIAEQLALRPATVSKWRHRFATQGVAGLADAPAPWPQPPLRRRERATDFEAVGCAAAGGPCDVDGGDGGDRVG